MTWMQTAISFSGIFFLCGFLSTNLFGCTTMDSNLVLEYKPNLKPMTSSALPVFLARVTDRRKDISRIGCKKNGFGGESANLFFEGHLTDWFSQAMNQELRRAGLGLVGAKAQGAVRLEVVLMEFFVEPTKSFFGSYEIYALIQAEVILRFPDGAGYARRFATLARDDSIIPTDGNYEEVAQKAMSNWIDRAVTDIVRLIEQKEHRTQTLGAKAAAWSR